MLPTTFETLPDRTRVRIARGGAGPSLVLLHGYPDNLHIWDRCATRLRERFDVLALDWPGLGRSDRPAAGGATPSHQARRLRAILQHLRIERAHVCGLDMGGQPALAFAAEFPDRTLSVTVTNSLVLGDVGTSWEIRLLRRFRFNRLLLTRAPRTVFRRALGTSLADPRGLDPELRAELWDCFRQPEVRRFLVRMCAGYEGQLPRLPELYGRIRAPALILWGDRDRHFPPAHARGLHSAVPGSRLEIVPGGEHWMVWEQAPKVARRLATFLSELER